MSRELHLKRLGFVWTYSEYYFNWVSAAFPGVPSFAGELHGCDSHAAPADCLYESGAALLQLLQPSRRSYCNRRDHPTLLLAASWWGHAPLRLCIQCSAALLSSTLLCD